MWKLVEALQCLTRATPGSLPALLPYQIPDSIRSMTGMHEMSAHIWKLVLTVQHLARATL